MRSPHTIAHLLVMLVVGSSSVAFGAHPAAAPSAFVRINHVGYITGESKRAILMASGSEAGATFDVIAKGGAVAYHAPIGAVLGAWSSTFPNTYLLDFSAVTQAGTYTIQVTGPIAAHSSTFAVDTAAQLYPALLSNAHFFYEAQHDGSTVDATVLSRKPSHLADQKASLYTPPTYDTDDVLVGSLTSFNGTIDASGGWFDAGDYLKFVQTSSYVDAIMLFGVREYPQLLKSKPADFAAEARYGLTWLQKMWDDSTKTLYYQVGIGDGNGTTILGDHDFWRLPEADDQLNVHPGDPNYYVKYRPVFRAGPPNSPISPNLAGRLSADLGLCSQIYRQADPAYANQCLIRAEHIFALADTNPGELRTVAPFDFYPESEWRDDLELGATELYAALADAQQAGTLPRGLPQTDALFYLRQAAHWAHAYVAGPNSGKDSLNLYDVSGLAHFELHHAITLAGSPSGLEVTTADLRADLKTELDHAVAQAKQDPFGYGMPYPQFDGTPHALGLAVEANFYDQLTGGTTYAAFGQAQRDWVLGRNAWGTSFIIGAGSTFPHCPQHQIANLAGSLTGASPVLLGGAVNGPNAASIFTDLGLQEGMRVCPPDGSDPYLAFSGKEARFIDNVIAWPSVEPALDYTAGSILLFAQEIGGAPQPLYLPLIAR